MFVLGSVVHFAVLFVPLCVCSQVKSVVGRCLQVNYTKDNWLLQAKLTGHCFSGPHVLSAIAGQVTDYPLKFLPLSEGAVEVTATMDT